MIRAVAALLSLAVVAAPAAADWTASGEARYRDREFDETGFTGNEPLVPIESADVEVLDAVTGAVLAIGATDPSGRFSVFVPDASTRDVYVRVLSRSSATADLFVTVGDSDSVPYAVASGTTAGHLPEADVEFGTLVAEIGAGGEAFNLFDMTLLGTDYLASLRGSRPDALHPIVVRWEANRGQTGSTASYGGIDVRDTGAYDDTVVLHEYGHWAVLHYSDDDNPGGIHALANCAQDPALAWDEGHASYFGNSALRWEGRPKSNVYIRTDGGPGVGRLTNWFDLESETQYACAGDTSEVTVARTLWDLADGPGTPDFDPGVDLEPHDGIVLPDVEAWEVMEQGLPGRSSITAEDFWDAWFEAPVANGFLPELQSVFSVGHGIDFLEDPFEPDDVKGESAPTAADGVSRTATFFSDPDGDGSGGGLVEEDWFIFAGRRDWRYEIETLDLRSAADTWIRLYDEGNGILAANNDRSSGDPSSYILWTAPSDGNYYVRVLRSGMGTVYGTYDLRITPPPDGDSDGTPDDLDDCPGDPVNDPDEDGLCATADNCPMTANAEQEDGDADGAGDDCDNCPADANPEQDDTDSDGFGDACDACPLDASNDLDADGHCEDLDVCPAIPDPGQEDSDVDGMGDACDACPLDAANDLDADGVCGDVDNCPAVQNAGQEDLDWDGAGDPCDLDRDGDGESNEADCAPDVVGSSAVPGEVPGMRLPDRVRVEWEAVAQGRVGDVYRGTVGPESPFSYSHVCVAPHRLANSWDDPETPSPGVLFYYLAAARNGCGGGPLGDGTGGPRGADPACVPDPLADFDADGIADLDDVCPVVADPDQDDSDGDGTGDACAP